MSWCRTSISPLATPPDADSREGRDPPPRPCHLRACLFSFTAWARQHLALAFTLTVGGVLAGLYLWHMYLFQDEALTRWVAAQTLNTNALTETAGRARLPAKYRMLHPLLLFCDYPLCRWLTVDCGLQAIPWFTANFVSLLHPCFGIAAAWVMWRAASPPEEPQPQTPARDVERAGFDSILHPPKPQAEGTASPPLLCLAALLFTLRNTLDTLDGVVARARANGKKLETGIGPQGLSGISIANGHVLDVITDMFGVTIFLMSIWIHFYRRRVRIERHCIPGLRMVVARLTGIDKGFVGCVDSLWASRILVLFGVACTCISGLSWETTMLKMQDIFDRHTDNKAVMELEQTSVVQVTYWLWSLTCSDAQFFYIIIAMLLGYLHDFVCALAVLGWAWLCVLSLFSAGVTKWLAMQTAAYTHTLPPA